MNINLNIYIVYNFNHCKYSNKLLDIRINHINIWFYTWDNYRKDIEDTNDIIYISSDEFRLYGLVIYWNNK